MGLVNPHISPRGDFNFNFTLDISKWTSKKASMVRIQSPEGTMVDYSSGFISYDDRFHEIQCDSPTLEILLE